MIFSLDPLRNFEPLTLFSIALTYSSQINHKNAYENMQAINHLPSKQQQKKPKHKCITHFTLKPLLFQKGKKYFKPFKFHNNFN